MKLPEVSRSCSIVGKPALGDEDNEQTVTAALLKCPDLQIIKTPIFIRKIHFLISASKALQELVSLIV